MATLKITKLTEDQAEAMARWICRRGCWQFHEWLEEYDGETGSPSLAEMLGFTVLVRPDKSDEEIEVEAYTWSYEDMDALDRAEAEADLATD